MVANVAGAILCLLFSLTGLIMGFRHKKAEWFFFSLLIGLVGGGMVLYLLLVKRGSP
jgi:hypothetical protein